MQVRRYWAKVLVELDEDGEPTTRAFWGGSDESEADAHARAKAIAAEHQGVWELPGDHGGWDDGYYGGTSVVPEPIADEWFDDAGERAAAITINRFGAQVLNTAWLPFVDVDFHIDEAWRQTPFLRAFNPWLRKRSQGGFFGGLLSRFRGGPKATDEDKLEFAIEHLARWQAEDPSRGVRVYRTAGGLRYLLTDPQMDPAGAAFRELGGRLLSDPLYLKLCEKQESFRARLSPKPWRMDGGSEHDYAVCRLVDVLGSERPADELSRELLDVHDRATGVGLDRPLA